MFYLPIAILAYFLNGASVLVDKFLLVKSFKDPLVYIFYFSTFSLIALFLLPFTQIPPSQVILLASLSTIFWTTGAYFMFKAIQIGQPSRVLPVIGALLPMFLLFYYGFFHQVITENQVWAIILLVLAVIMLNIGEIEEKHTEKLSLRHQIKYDFLHFPWKEIGLEVLAALLFAVSYIILKEAYLQFNFLSVFVYSRFILIPVGILLILIPKFRKIILAKDDSPKINFFSKMGILFLIGQSCGGSAELLLTYSISLANPAVVNSLQGTQYAFIFLTSLFLTKKFPDVFKENFSKIAITGKIAGIILVFIGVYILAQPTEMKQIPIGVTYSPRYAEELGLSPQQTFDQMLDDLNPGYIRLPIYWDEVEKASGQYDFSSIDYYMQAAEKNGTKVIPVLGFKQPRWPECFAPDWAERLGSEEFGQQILNLVQTEVDYFKKYPNVIAWQVENEPFLNFGVCNFNVDKRSQILPQEIEIVRTSDNRPVLITDSGELSTWRNSLKLGDWFGTTLYRNVWNPIIGVTTYPLPPLFYTLKEQLVGLLTNAHPQEVLVMELQAEPWATKGRHLVEIPIDEQMKLFPVTNLANNLKFAKETNFNGVYFWGVEWWYFMNQQGESRYLDAAKKIFNN